MFGHGKNLGGPHKHVLSVKTIERGKKGMDDLPPEVAQQKHKDKGERGWN